MVEGRTVQPAWVGSRKERRPVPDHGNPPAPHPGLKPRASRRLALIPAVIAVLLATLTVTSPVHAQEPTATPTVQDVLARHVEARGGAEAWARVQALRITGTYSALSEEADFTLWRQRPGSYRFEYGILGERATEVYDGRSGWMQSPVEGWPWPVPMNGPQLTTARSLAELDSPLMDAAAKGHEVELVGRSDFDGIDTWELNVTLAGEAGEDGDKTGNEETWHLDAETYLPVARILPAVDFGRAVGTQEVFYDDHREVDGVMFPFFIQSEYFIRLNIWTVDAIEVNPEIPEGLFTRPAPEGMSRLASMAGRWTVKVESRPAPRAPWTEDGATTSEITSGLGGGVLDERLTLTVQGRPVETRRSYTWDRFRDVYRLAHTDELSQHLNVFEGTFGGSGDESEGNAEGDEETGDTPDTDADTLVLTNLDTGTPLVIGQPIHGRISVSDLGPDGFRIEQSVSTDAGESWFENVRLTYTRAE